MGNMNKLPLLTMKPIAVTMVSSGVKVAGCIGVVVFAAALALGSARTATAAGAGSTVALASGAAPAEPEELTFENRYIFTFRATVLGSNPAARVQAAQARLEAAPTHIAGDAVATIQAAAGGERGFAVRVSEQFVFAVAEADVDPLANETVEKAASAAAARL